MKTREDKIFRIIDANFNRSREGLRVCEEIARFVLNSKVLTEDLKSVRHKISTIRKNTSPSLIASRDVEGDVAKDSLVRARTKRTTLADIYQANMQRSKESIRVLEEFFKLIDESVSRKLQSLRFDVYEIEKKSAGSIARLNK